LNTHTETDTDTDTDIDVHRRTDTDTIVTGLFDTKKNVSFPHTHYTPFWQQLHNIVMCAFPPDTHTPHTSGAAPALQRVAVWCGLLDRVAVCCSVVRIIGVYYSVWQCVAVHCAVCLRILHSTPPSLNLCCSMLQCSALCCGVVLQTSRTPFPPNPLHAHP